MTKVYSQINWKRKDKEDQDGHCSTSIKATINGVKVDFWTADDGQEGGLDLNGKPHYEADAETVLRVALGLAGLIDVTELRDQVQDAVINSVSQLPG